MRLPILLATLLAAGAAHAADGEAVFDQACATCHFKHRDPARMSEMVAPPIDMMAAHVREVTGPDRAAFVDRVVDFITAPAPEKAVDPRAIERFGLMPPIGDTFPDLTAEDLAAVAGWIYDTYADVRLPTEQERQRLMQQTQ